MIQTIEAMPVKDSSMKKRIAKDEFNLYLQSAVEGKRTKQGKEPSTITDSNVDLEQNIAYTSNQVEKEASLKEESQKVSNSSDVLLMIKASTGIEYALQNNQLAKQEGGVAKDTTGTQDNKIVANKEHLRAMMDFTYQKINTEEIVSPKVVGNVSNYTNELVSKTAITSEEKIQQQKLTKEQTFSNTLKIIEPLQKGKDSQAISVINGDSEKVKFNTSQITINKVTDSLQLNANAEINQNTQKESKVIQMDEIKIQKTMVLKEKDMTGEVTKVKHDNSPFSTNIQMKEVNGPIDYTTQGKGAASTTIAADNVNKVEEAIIRQLNMLKEGNSTVMKVKLHPKELGMVDIELRMDEGKVSAKILVENDYAKQLFGDKHFEIRQGLKLQNVELSQLDIDMNFDGESSNSNKSDQFETSYQMSNSKLEDVNEIIANKTIENTSSATSINVLA